MNVERFVAFLRRLVRDAGQKVFLIVDNLNVHHARKIQAWVASHAPPPVHGWLRHLAGG